MSYPPNTDTLPKPKFTRANNINTGIKITLKTVIWLGIFILIPHFLIYMYIILIILLIPT